MLFSLTSACVEIGYVFQNNGNVSGYYIKSTDITYMCMYLCYNHH
jgi:hypothetical protein